MPEIMLKEYRTHIDLRLDMLLSESGQKYDEVVRAARYSLLCGGKRIRPVLLLEFYKLCGGDDDCAYNFACALEMIHTYSLIHDDLPCMDDDDFRRGRPSLHKQYNEPMALLAGDALLTEAFCAAAKTRGLPAERVARGIEVLSSCAGIHGMVGGQVLDVFEIGEDTDGDELSDMYRLKTGALLRAATVCGCILAGGTDEQEKAAAVYAEKLGCAFQIVDDLLDAEGDEQILGKPVGSDQKNGKTTFVTLYGAEKAREYAETLTREAHESLSAFDGDTSRIAALTDYLLLRNK